MIRVAVVDDQPLVRAGIEMLLNIEEDITGIAQLWADYKALRTREARDRLIVHYSPLVKYVAGRVAVGLPQNIEQSDLVSYGVFGLIDAIEKYDDQRGVKFETYAITRISGAILDALRALDWVPRAVRQKARELERVYQELEIEHGRALCGSYPTLGRTRPAKQSSEQRTVR